MLQRQSVVFCSGTWPHATIHHKIVEFFIVPLYHEQFSIVFNSNWSWMAIGQTNLKFNWTICIRQRHGWLIEFRIHNELRCSRDLTKWNAEQRRIEEEKLLTAVKPSSVDRYSHKWCKFIVEIIRRSPNVLKSVSAAFIHKWYSQTIWH